MTGVPSDFQLSTKHLPNTNKCFILFMLQRLNLLYNTSAAANMSCWGYMMRRRVNQWHLAHRRTIGPLGVFWQMIAFPFLTGEPLKMHTDNLTRWTHWRLQLRGSKTVTTTSTIKFNLCFTAVAEWVQSSTVPGEASRGQWVTVVAAAHWKSAPNEGRRGLRDIKESSNMAGGANNTMKREGNKMVQRQQISPSPKMRAFNYHSQRAAKCVTGAGLNFSQTCRPRVSH